MPLTLKGYSVHISCDGVEIPQYQVEVVDDRNVTCYIPSDAGKSFSVHCTDNNKDGHEGKAIYIFADGRHLSTGGYPAGENDEISHQVDNWAGVKRAFQFSKVQLTQDGMDELERAQIGLIKICIVRAVRKNEPISRKMDKAHDAGDGLLAPEKSKLVGFNHVSLGKGEIFTPRKYGFCYVPIDTFEEPFVAFHFRHRPAELLQAMDIMPRPKPRTPEPSSSAPRNRTRPSDEPNDRRNKRRKVTDNALQRTSAGTRSRSPIVREEDVKPIIDIDDDDDEGIDEQRRALEASLREIQSSLHSVQSQLHNLSQGSRRKSRVKMERAPSPIQVGGSGEVIDLTDDC